MTRLARFRIWIVAGLLAASSLQCNDGTDTRPPTDIRSISGDGQNGRTGQPLSQPLVVQVTDESGDPVPDVAVSWAAQGGGSVSDETGRTGSDGRSSVQRILGSEPGEQTTTATVPGLNGSPVTFTATALIGVEPGVSVVTQPPPSALSEEVWAPSNQPVVAVSDPSGTPIIGTQVTATIATGSGTLEGNTTATTDASGVASFADLGIRGSGSHTLRFTAASNNAESSDVSITPLSAEATTGAWGPVVNWEIVPLHMNLLPSGKIFAWGKTDVADTMGMPRVWDPAQGPPSTAQMIDVNEMLFCAGHTLMPDGSLMIAGGHHMDDAGIKVTYFYGLNGSWSQGPNMAHGRWYPTLTVLPSGRILTMAGQNEAGNVVKTPEVWENGSWVELPGAGDYEVPYYPRNFVDPKNGLVFYASERIDSRWFDVDGSSPTGRGRWIPGPPHVYRFNREYGSAVMYDTGMILVMGGGGHTGWESPDPKATTPTATAERIDLNQTSPAWQSTGSMAFRRRHMNATVLPDGQVLATGGTRGGGFVDISEANAVKAAELWNPATGQWTTLASNRIMRIYHSVSLLLPDGTVLHGSSGDAMAGAIPVPPQRNHEIFSPPYLFRGARPSITGVSPSSATVGYGQTFTVTTPNAAQIAQVRWIRLGSVTHAFDMSARANTLSFSRSANGVDITAPANANLAPPGHYLLFILNRNGVPSEGTIVRVQ